MHIPLRPGGLFREEYALFQKAIRQEEALQDKAVEEDAEEREISVLEEQTHEQQWVLPLSFACD